MPPCTPKTVGLTPATEKPNIGFPGRGRQDLPQMRSHQQMLNPWLPKGRFQAISVGVHWLIFLILRLKLGAMICNMVGNASTERFLEQCQHFKLHSGTSSGQCNLACYDLCDVIFHLNLISYTREQKIKLLILPKKYKRSTMRQLSSVSHKHLKKCNF